MTEVQSMLLEQIRREVSTTWDVRAWGPEEIRIAQWDDPASEHRSVKHQWFVKSLTDYNQLLPSMLAQFIEGHISEEEVKQVYNLFRQEEINQEGLTHLKRELWERLSIHERVDWYEVALLYSSFKEE